MSALTRIADSRYAKTTTLAALLLGFCTLASTVSVADPGAPREVTERGTASLAGLLAYTAGGATPVQADCQCRRSGCCHLRGQGSRRRAAEAGHRDPGATRGAGGTRGRLQALSEHEWQVTDLEA